MQKNGDLESSTQETRTFTSLRDFVLFMLVRLSDIRQQCTDWLTTLFLSKKHV